MKLAIVLVLLAGACHRKPPPPANEFEAFEREFVDENEQFAKALRKQGKEISDDEIPTGYRAVFVGPSGVFVDRQRIAGLDNLESKRADLVAAIDANTKLMPTIKWTPSVTLDLDDEPAATGIAVLRLFAGHKLLFLRRDHFTEADHAPDVRPQASHMFGELTISDRAPTDKEVPHLSILLDPGKLWVGQSIKNEFELIPDLANHERDYEKLLMILHQHKSTADFADRFDIELSAGKVGTAAEVITTLDQLSRAGFFEIAVLPREQLSAVPLD